MTNSVICCMLLVLLLSCRDKNTIPTRQELIKIELNKKISNYHEMMKRKCKTKALKQAHIKVDSIVRQKHKFNHLNNIEIPEKPIKPTLNKEIINNRLSEKTISK